MIQGVVPGNYKQVLLLSRSLSRLSFKYNHFTLLLFRDVKNFKIEYLFFHKKTECSSGDIRRASPSY